MGFATYQRTCRKAGPRSYHYQVSPIFCSRALPPHPPRPHPCPHGLLHSWVLRFRGSCVPGFLSSWDRSCSRMSEFIGVWVSAFLGWVPGFIGGVPGFPGAKVPERGCLGSRAPAGSNSDVPGFRSSRIPGQLKSSVLGFLSFSGSRVPRPLSSNTLAFLGSCAPRLLRSYAFSVCVPTIL